MTLSRKTLLPVLLATVALAMAARPALADTMTYSLTAGNSAISGFAGPYGSVLVSRTDTTHATITFTSNTVAGNIYLFGDGGSVAVNVNAVSWTLGAITGSNAGTGFALTNADYSNGGSGTEDGFGFLNQTINTFDGFQHTSDTISFTLTATGGSTWAAASNVLTANSNGAIVAAHIFVTTAPANVANGALATGFAANGGATVPDGGMTISLLGMAMAGLGAMARTRK